MQQALPGLALADRPQAVRADANYASTLTRPASVLPILKKEVDASRAAQVRPPVVHQAASLSGSRFELVDHGVEAL